MQIEYCTGNLYKVECITDLTVLL